MPDESEELDLDKEVFTTFEVADICNANITSIKNWIEENELKAHQTPGGHYRVRREDLQKFLDRYRMPNPFRERKEKRILAFHEDAQLRGELENRFGEVHEYAQEEHLTRTLLRLGDWRPDALILQQGLDGAQARSIVEAMQSMEHLRPIDVVVVHEGDGAAEERLREAGAGEVVRASEGTDALLEAVEYRIL